MRLNLHIQWFTSGTKPLTDGRFSLTSSVCSRVCEKKMRIFRKQRVWFKSELYQILTRKLARVYLRKRRFDNGIVCLRTLSMQPCKILSSFAHTGTNSLSRKTCSSYRGVSELVKKLVKENLLVRTGLV